MQEFSWYALFTNVREERRVSEALTRQGCATFLPTYRRWYLQARNPHSPLFPRYAFVGFSEGSAPDFRQIEGFVKLLPDQVPSQEMGRLMFADAWRVHDQKKPELFDRFLSKRTRKRGRWRAMKFLKKGLDGTKEER